MKEDNVDPQVFNFLDELKPVPLRDPHAAARGRSQFLSEAVSLREKQRHSGWMIFPYKETIAMKIAISALVIVGLLVGGSATVSAAQDDLPNQPLYQLKLVREDVQLWFEVDPVRQIDLLIEQEQIRLDEMKMLVEEGVVPPAVVAVRAQERIERALQIASQLDEASEFAALQQIHTLLQVQEQQMLQLEQGTCIECIPVLRQTRDMLRLHLGETEQGQTNPGAVPDQNQNEIQTQTQNQNQMRSHQTPWATATAIPPHETGTPALDGTGQQNGSGGPSLVTPVQQQNHTQQQNQGGGGNQNGQGSGGGDGSSTGTGGQGGRP